jgi:hypothetical protein
MSNREARIIGGLVLACSALWSCSLAARVTVFNDSGGTITIHRHPHFAWDAREVVIERGGHRTFVGGDLNLNEAALSAGRCRYTYAIPWAFPDGRKGGPRMAIQVEPDFSVVVIPPSARAVAPREVWLGVQGQGFPVHAVSVACPAAAAPKTTP